MIYITDNFRLELVRDSDLQNVSLDYVDNLGAVMLARSAVAHDLSPDLADILSPLLDINLSHISAKSGDIRIGRGDTLLVCSNIGTEEASYRVLYISANYNYFGINVAASNLSKNAVDAETEVDGVRIVYHAEERETHLYYNYVTLIKHPKLSNRVIVHGMIDSSYLADIINNG